MKTVKETRSFNITSSETRSITGYAIVFNSPSNVLFDQKRGLFFNEIINPDAVTEDLLLRSDIVMNYAHDDNLILARSKYGDGTLQLTLDEKGLRFDFEMPQTALGEQILESLRRGDIDGCSFCFSLDTTDPESETWEQREDGTVIRTINKIHGLYDCAIVVHEAYPETEVSQRALDIIHKYNENTQMKQEDIEIREDEKEDEKLNEQENSSDDKNSCEKNNLQERKNEDEPDKDEEKPEETDDSSEQEKPQETDDSSEQEKPQENDKEEEKKDEDVKDEETQKENKNTQNKRSITMEKRFSLLSAIRSIANGEKLNAAEQAVVNAGLEEMRNAGQSITGQIQIPVEERADEVHYTVQEDGEHVVVTDYLNILEPLKARNVLVNAGANYLTGLKGNVQIPSMTAENVYWEGEIDETDNGAGTFSHITMAPRRLSAYIDISKQFLVQDTLGAENLIRKLLVEAINDKLEETILSNDAESGAKPAGIFYNVTPTEIVNYSDICDFEAGLEESNFVGEMKYVLSPKAKAALRSMIKGTNATGMILEGNAVDGTPAEVTTNIDTKCLAYGAWENLYIGQWGAVDLTVDPYTKAASGQVRLVINAFFDYKVVRDGAIVYGTIKEDGSNG